MDKIIFFQLFQMHPLFKSEQNFFDKLSKLQSDFFKDHHRVEEVLREHHHHLFAYWQESGAIKNTLWSQLLHQQQRGFSWVARGDAEYPKCFYYLDDPPWLLNYLGSLELFQKPLIAVVGSREMSPFTEKWLASELNPFIKENKLNVVSGGARGVDQWSHLSSLRAQEGTVVIVPSGLGHIYPSSLKNWCDEILEKKGVLISEFPFGCGMQKSFFQHRNRLIAAAGLVTLVVQARQRSGTMITAQRAAHLGKAVWVVPGHPCDIHFEGSMNLIAEGATLVRDAQELGAYWKSECQMMAAQSLPIGNFSH
ncbi:MAG: DNA-processing protein DprA [Bdellovibrionia bacterium]